MNPAQRTAPQGGVTAAPRRRPRLALVLLVALVALSKASPAAAAAPSPDESARAHHEQGRVAAGLGRFEIAIAEYRRAYELKADPSYLYDIADAYRSLGVAERAVFFYRRYLSAHPNPPNRPEVEGLIARLDPAPPVIVVAPVPAAAPMLELAPAQHLVSDRERSVVGRWWFWTAVGALAAAGATIAILAASRKDDDVPSTRLGNWRVPF